MSSKINKRSWIIGINKQTLYEIADEHGYTKREIDENLPMLIERIELNLTVEAAIEIALVQIFKSRE